jgi:hypothetical protein
LETGGYKEMKKFLLEKIYSFSSWLNVWSWQKLYGKRKK